MMRLIAIVAMLGLAACVQNQEPLPSHDVKQQPTITKPGVHVSGHANVGVVRTF